MTGHAAEWWRVRGYAWRNGWHEVFWSEGLMSYRDAADELTRLLAECRERGTSVDRYTIEER